MGVSYEDNQEFDSSWGRGQSIEFPLTGLIAYWQEGIPGMKVGGRRKLIIPPEKAYGLCRCAPTRWSHLGLRY